MVFRITNTCVGQFFIPANDGFPNDSADREIRPTNYVGKCYKKPYYKNPLTVCILYIIYNIILHGLENHF